MITLKRNHENPVLKPNYKQSWEAEAVFNGSPIRKNDQIFLLYRAQSMPHYHASADMQMSISDIGIASSTDGVHFGDRKRFVVPEEAWESFGCEDPRITKIDDTYYIFYTALSKYPFTAEGIRVGLAISKDLKTISEKHLVTPFNAKAMGLFSEKINGKFCAILTADTDQPPATIGIAMFDKEEDMWSQDFWDEWYVDKHKHALDLQLHPEDHIEVGAPPIKTDKGWLFIYSYIRQYHSDNKLFTIEAALLDLNDPTKIIGRTKYPMLFPEREYEEYGMVPNIVFPSGAMIDKDELLVYYGAADTTVCLATTPLAPLLELLACGGAKRVLTQRSKTNPILTSRNGVDWEINGVFNPAAIYLDNKVHIVYRAMSSDNTSTFGYASSVDGLIINERLSEPIYKPRETFEKKLVSGGNSGCEDPRISKIGDQLYMFYTAFDGKHPPRIAMTSIFENDFIQKKWNWKKPMLISPPEFDNKDACVLPEKILDKYMIFHRFGNDIDIALVSDLEFSGEKFLEERRWMYPRKGIWDSLKIGISAPPIKTNDGWVLLYHGVSEEDHHYRVGAVLLDLNDPSKIIGRTDEPILEPEESYEKEGVVSNVVFPCGAVVIDDTLYIYYGGGDLVTGVATISMKILVEYLKESQ
jgi:beta-1,2-mannobiose phosphorylase / 1,2-beta-oligomannan phosphorylase